MSDDRIGDRVADRDYLDIQRFLNREAALLDRRLYDDWLALLTDDIAYRVTAQVTRDAQAGGLDYAIVDEGVAGLRARAAQIGSPKLTHAENPAPLMRRFVSNIQASPGPSPEEFAVESNLLVYRSRSTIPDGHLYVGERHDILRRIDGGLRLARRDVRLDHAILFGGVLSTLL